MGLACTATCTLDGVGHGGQTGHGGGTGQTGHGGGTGQGGHGGGTGHFLASHSVLFFHNRNPITRASMTREAMTANKPFDEAIAWRARSASLSMTHTTPKKKATVAADTIDPDRCRVDNNTPKPSKGKYRKKI